VNGTTASVYIFMAALSVGCAAGSALTPPAAPAPARSNHFVTTGGGFAVDLADDKRTVESCVYALSLTPATPLTTPLYLRVFFEDPRNPSQPLVVTSTAAPGQSDISIKSPEIRGIRKNGEYSVRVEIYDSPEMKTKMGEHTQHIQSSLAIDREVSF